jgi:hypothetical protein
MKQSADIAHFRQQCCLGIDAQTAMPSLLRALRVLIGSQANSFYWADRNGDISNVSMEQVFSRDMAAHYFSEFVNNRADDYSALGSRKFLPPGALVGCSTAVSQNLLPLRHVQLDLATAATASNALGEGPRCARPSQRSHVDARVRRPRLHRTRVTAPQPAGSLFGACHKCLPYRALATGSRC